MNKLLNLLNKLKQKALNLIDKVKGLLGVKKEPTFAEQYGSSCNHVDEKSVLGSYHYTVVAVPARLKPTKKSKVPQKSKKKPKKSSKKK